MASEIALPRRKPPKQHLLSCFGCRSRRESIKSKSKKEAEENGQTRRKPWGLYWSIRRSAPATVPVEDEAGDPSVTMVLDSGRSGDVSRYSQRRREQEVSVARTGDCSNRQYVRQGSDTVERPKRSPPPPQPPPPPPPHPITTSTVARPKQRRDADNRLDPTVGMSIVLVTLIVLVLWGQAPAVLCTAALFYVIPRLRRDRDAGKGGRELARGEVDLSSEENKKRVVLEGLLERSRRPDGLHLPTVI